jgi:hypothetical protein
VERLAPQERQPGRTASRAAITAQDAEDRGEKRLLNEEGGFIAMLLVG